MDLLSELTGLRNRLESINIDDIPRRSDTVNHSSEDWKGRIKSIGTSAEESGTKPGGSSDQERRSNTGEAPGLTDLDRRLASLEQLIGPSEASLEAVSLISSEQSPTLTDHPLSELCAGYHYPNQTRSPIITPHTTTSSRRYISTRQTPLGRPGSCSSCISPCAHRSGCRWVYVPEPSIGRIRCHRSAIFASTFRPPAPIRPPPAPYTNIAHPTTKSVRLTRPGGRCGDWIGKAERRGETGHGGNTESTADRTRS